MNKPKLFSLLLGTAILLLPFFALAYQVKAVSVEKTGDFLLSPSKLDLRVEPGEKMTKRLSVTNRSESSLVFNISTEDMVGSTNPEESMKFLGEKSGGEFSLKNWIKPETKVFALEPGQQINFDVEISVPDDAGAGGRYAALFVTAKKAGDESPVQSLSRLAAIFLVEVGGENGKSVADQSNQSGGAKLRPLELGRTDKQILPHIKMVFENNDKIHIVPSGKLAVYDLLGRMSAEINIDNWYILPASVRERIVDIPAKFYFGRYTAIVDLSWVNPLNGLVYKDIQKISFWIIPPKAILISLIVLAVIITTLLFSRKIRKKRGLYCLAILLVCSVALAPVVEAAMSSTNYKITDDSLSVGGIETGNSSNYQLKDTIGDIGGNASSSNFTLKGGYRSRVFSSISITTPSNITMTSCSQSTACTSDSTVSWTVTTDNSSGYTLALSASTAPALKSGGNSFSDFSPSGTTGFWSVGATASVFGFAVGSSGQTDIVSAFKDDSSACSAGSSVGSCYRGFNGTNSIQIVSRSSAASSGNATTVKLRAQVGSSYVQPIGTYSTAVTAMAAAL